MPAIPPIKKLPKRALRSKPKFNVIGKFPFMKLFIPMVPKIPISSPNKAPINPPTRPSKLDSIKNCKNI